MTHPAIHRVMTLDLVFKPRPWPFAESRREDILAHFARQQREKPNLWNGRVLLGRNPAFTTDRFSADYFEADFASFLAWRDCGFPDREVFNGFGMGALRCADGAFLLGEMGQHTSNAGRVYFPSGTPDLDDIMGNAVDISGSVAREVEEETGLSTPDYRADAPWDCVVSGAAIAMIKVLNVALTGEELRARITANLAGTRRASSGARHLRSHACDAALRHRVYREAFCNAALS